MNNITIEPKTVVKYLGMYLDHKLNFNKHISEPKNKAQKITSTLYHLTSQKSVLSEKNKLLLYKVIIRPTLMYAAPIIAIIAT